VRWAKKWGSSRAAETPQRHRTAALPAGGFPSDSGRKRGGERATDFAIADFRL